MTQQDYLDNYYDIMEMKKELRNGTKDQQIEDIEDMEDYLNGKRNLKKHLSRKIYRSKLLRQDG
jgi:hypothetical protein